MFLKNFPLILSLLAGLIACVVTFINEYSGIEWLLIVLGALLLFYIIGLCVRRVFAVFLAEKEQPDDTIDEENEDMETEAVESVEE